MLTRWAGMTCTFIEVLYLNELLYLEFICYPPLTEFPNALVNLVILGDYTILLAAPTFWLENTIGSCCPPEAFVGLCNC